MRGGFLSFWHHEACKIQTRNTNHSSPVLRALNLFVLWPRAGRGWRTGEMNRTHFETLRAYQLAEVLGDRIWQIVNAWEWFPRDTIGRQVVRSADSIGANVAEGTGRSTVGDNRRFVVMARGSLYETKHWLRRAYRRGLLTTSQTAQLKTMVDELTRVLNGYLRSLDRRRELGE